MMPEFFERFCPAIGCRKLVTGRADKVYCSFGCRRKAYYRRYQKDAFFLDLMKSAALIQERTGETV
jgi:hypothetical protein